MSSGQIDAGAVIEYFYAAEPELKRTLLIHSMQVRDKALAIAAGVPEMALSREILIVGSMLHDIGIIGCNASGIGCHGSADYLAHGMIGGKMLREYGRQHGIDLEWCARICERHTGSGLTAAEIVAQKLPLPPVDMVPESAEEKLICLADKFFSKSGSMQEKSLTKIRKSLARHSESAVARFDIICREFKITE